VLILRRLTFFKRHKLIYEFSSCQRRHRLNGVIFMLSVLRPQVARLAQWNLMPGALAIAAVAL